MSTTDRAVDLLTKQYGLGTADLVSVPGRVNLIGEHVDYHDLPVLPMAIQRVVTIAFRARMDGRVRAVSSAQVESREFDLARHLEPEAAGDWVNYLRAAAVAVQTAWPIRLGIDAAVDSDLPVAAGLSSSSALLAGFALALLRVNGIEPTVEELMAVLPEGEHYVGTRGGGMDHAAVTAARRGCALLVGFAPLTLRQIAIPAGWRFLVAHSLTKAEKSGAVKAKYNALRQEGVRALRALDLISYRETLEGSDNLAFAGALGGREQAVFAHVTSEAMRVRSAVIALETGRLEEFGRLLSESHASLRDQLNVSTPAIDALVDAAMDSGASGARLTGAGFGGCVIVLCNDRTIAKVRDGLIARYYSTFAGFHPSLTRFQPSLAGFQPDEEDLFEVEASDGALARYGGLANYGALAR